MLCSWDGKRVRIIRVQRSVGPKDKERKTDRRMDTTDCSTFLANTVASGGSTLGLGDRPPNRGYALQI